MDLVAFSHLRWTFVYQRPHHLFSRAARRHRVFFIEEPVRDAVEPWTEISRQDGVEVVVPHVSAEPARREPAGRRGDELATLVAGLVTARRITQPIAWYDTPAALPWSRDLVRDARAVVYDCSDDVSAFKGPPAEIRAFERELLDEADVVFTARPSLYEARRPLHPGVHHVPNSVDVMHFGRARGFLPEPPDQVGIGRPRIGYFGVLDERLDWDLLEGLARRRPDWQLVLLGPTATMDRRPLPAAPNVHYLGLKPYRELPAYLAGWDVAILPFARNDATRYISPTKTPEYLAGGKPVASTPIRDVIEPYARLGLVHVGEGVEGFGSAVDAALRADRQALQRAADRALEGRSWDRTWAEMEALIERAIVTRAFRAAGAALPAGRRDPRGTPSPRPRRSSAGAPGRSGGRRRPSEAAPLLER